MYSMQEEDIKNMCKEITQYLEHERVMAITRIDNQVRKMDDYIGSRKFIEFSIESKLAYIYENCTSEVAVRMYHEYYQMRALYIRISAIEDHINEIINAWRE